MRISKSEDRTPGPASLSLVAAVQETGGLQVVSIKLLNGKMIFVDKADWHRLEEMKITTSPWFLFGSYRYVATFINTKAILIHRAIMDAAEGECIVFRSKNRLDLRRANLRVSNKSSPTSQGIRSRLRKGPDPETIKLLFGDTF